MSKEELICSFCARTKSQTQLLIAGLDAHICDKCILQAYGIIEDENGSRFAVADVGFTPLAPSLQQKEMA